MIQIPNSIFDNGLKKFRVSDWNLRRVLVLQLLPKEREWSFVISGIDEEIIKKRGWNTIRLQSACNSNPGFFNFFPLK
jgi:hypothetical protein